MGKRVGRKRKIGVIRHPSGQIQAKSAYEVERDARQTALEARQRVFGVSSDDASKQEAGSVVGRLLLQGEIKKWQYEAAIRYEEAIRAANRAYLSKGFPSPGDLNRSRGHDASDGTDSLYVAKCKAAIAEANKCHRALRDCGELMARFVVDEIVVEGREMPLSSGELRLGLNALCRLFKIPMPAGNRQKAA